MSATRDDLVAQAESALAARGADTLVLIDRASMGGCRPRVQQFMGKALITGPWGERVLVDRHHLELMAMAVGCKLVDAAPSRPAVPAEFHASADVEIPLDSRTPTPAARVGSAREPSAPAADGSVPAGLGGATAGCSRAERRCVACEAVVGVMTADAWDELGQLCDECGARA